MRRHLERPAAAGKNILSYLCCNYALAKIVVEPFLQTTGKVQDLVDSSTECIQMSRSRLSCSEFLSSAHLDEEEGNASNTANAEDESGKKKKRFGWCSTSVQVGRYEKLVHYITITFTVCLIALFIYASFTM